MAEPDKHEARELSIYAVNERQLYDSRALPIIANLARKMLAGTYDADKALISWRHLADEAASRYRKEWSLVDVFSAPTRALAAVEIAEHYAEQLADTAVSLRWDKTLAERWPLSAIRAAHMESGGHFFDRKTMRAFGDTVASFRVEVTGGEVFLRRVRPMRDRDGRDMGGVGKRYAFNPDNGRIWGTSRD